jgi:hypothetical protein
MAGNFQKLPDLFNPLYDFGIVAEPSSQVGYPDQVGIRNFRQQSNDVPGGLLSCHGLEIRLHNPTSFALLNVCQ